MTKERQRAIIRIDIGFTHTLHMSTQNASLLRTLPSDYIQYISISHVYFVLGLHKLVKKDKFSGVSAFL